MRFKEFHKIILERRMKGPQSIRSTWLYGTSSYFLRNILKEGLLAQPKTGLNNRTPKDSNGIYLTRDVVKAVIDSKKAVSEFEGNPLIVVCDVQPKTLIPSEDVFGYNFLDPYIFYSHGFGADEARDAYTSLKTGENPNNIYYNVDQKMLKWVRHKFHTIYNLIGHDIHTNLKNIIVQFLQDKAWPVVLELIINKTIKINDPDFPTMEEGERKLQEVVSDLTKIIRKYTKTSPERVSARSLSDIGFRGSNKIIGIVSYDKADDTMNIHYGKVPDDLLTEIKNRFK